MSEQTIEEVKTPPVTDAEKINFFKSFLSDQPYKAIESLFNGQFIVEFKSIDVQQATDVFTQMRKDQSTHEISSDANYMMALTNYRLAQAVNSINGVPFQPDITKATYKPVDGNDSYIKAKAAVLQTWPVFKLSALAEAFKAFEDKTIYLTSEVQSENFWPAAK